MKFVKVSFENVDNLVNSVSEQERLMLEGYWFKYYEKDTGIPIDDLKAGSCVVVITRYGLALAYILTAVSTIDEVQQSGFTGNITAQVVDIVDLSKWQRRKQIRARMLELKKLLDQQAKSAERMAMYRLLAKDNLELSNLLTEFDELKSQCDEL